jgi:spermidine synthase
MMKKKHQPNNPKIELVEENSGETTLYIDGRQAMQAWEVELMQESADMLCTYGSEFLEVGLGLGISALHIARHPNTRKHVVVEKYQRVIDLFYERHPAPPPTLEVRHADFVNLVPRLKPASLDGIFFDPYLPTAMREDMAFWDKVVPLMIRTLRPGGVFLPCFTTRPVLNFIDYFDRAIVERRSFTAYPTTEYTCYGTSGDALIQCYVKTR